jgi:hypothetical protein
MKGLFWKIVIKTRWHLPRGRRERDVIGGRIPDFTLRDFSGRPFILSLGRAPIPIDSSLFGKR